MASALPPELEDGPLWYIEWQDFNFYAFVFTIIIAPDYDAAYAECKKHGPVTEVRRATSSEIEEYNSPDPKPETITMRLFDDV